MFVERAYPPHVHAKLLRVVSLQLPAAVARLVDALHALPGVGEKTAQRLALYLVRAPERVVLELGTAASQLRTDLKLCSTCRHITDVDPCPICADHARDASRICVVEEPLDLIAFERAGAYRGRYHVLHGVLNPLDGIGPEMLTIADLVARVTNEPPTEVIIATSPSVEGEATAMFISRQLKPLGVTVTRLARGIPTGAELSYADDATLSHAFAGRREF